MDTLILLFIFSVLLNLFLIRWAIGERLSRRRWQKDAAALQNALRHHDPTLVASQRSSAVGFWLVVGMFFLFGVLAVLVN